MPDNTAENHAAKYFDSTMTLLLGESEGAYDNFCDMKTDPEGTEDFNYDAYEDQKTARKRQSRMEDTPDDDINFTRRRITFDTFSTGKSIDRMDKRFMPQDPTDPVMQALANRITRSGDLQAASALFGPAYGAKAGDTTYTFPPTSIIAVNDWTFGTGSGNAGLTIPKIINARRRLRKCKTMSLAQMKARKMVLDCCEDQLANLLTYTETTDINYSNAKRLVDGETDYFLGFYFNRVSDDIQPKVSANRLVSARFHDSLVIVRGPDFKRYGERADKSYNQHGYVERRQGSGRRAEDTIVQIECLES